jgi:hypothetical protein
MSAFITEQQFKDLYDYATDEEREQWDEGGDPCDLVLKLL